MARQKIHQDKAIRSSDVYSDTVVPTESAFETDPNNAETDFNNIRSQIHNLISAQSSNWWEDLVAPTDLEPGTKRGVNNLNVDLHSLEKKRLLREVIHFVPIVVGASNNFVVLGTGELPPNTTAAVAGTTLGTVVAPHVGSFGSHSLDVITGNSAVNPQNLVAIITDTTNNPILSGGDKVYGLLQSESAADGHTITDSSTTRVQISFVKIDGTGTGLIAVPAGDIQGKTIDYFPVERVRLQDLGEQDLLNWRIIDIVSGDTDTDAIHDNVAGEIAAITEKAAPVGGDFLILEDSADDFKKRKVDVANLPTGTGVTPAMHRGLDQLPHRIAEDSHTQVTRVGGKVVNITIWTTPGMTVKIRETKITRSAGKVSKIEEIQYDVAGVVIVGETNTQTVNRLGGKVDSIDAVLT